MATFLDNAMLQAVAGGKALADAPALSSLVWEATRDGPCVLDRRGMNDWLS